MRASRATVATILATAGLVAVGLCLRPNGQSLLNASSPVADTSAWYLPGCAEYYWLDDTSLLRFTGTDRDHLTPVRVDTRTGESSTLSGLAQIMRTSAEFCNVDVASSSILWNDNSELWPYESLETKVHLCDISGQWHRIELRSWPCCWLNDGLHWLEWSRDNAATTPAVCTLHSIEGGKTARLSVPPGVDARFSSICRNGDEWKLCRVDWHDARETDRPYVEVSEAHLDLDKKRVSQPRVHRLTLEPGTFVVDATVSPTGDQLAWIAVVSPNPLFGRLLKTFRHDGDHSHCEAQLLLSNLEGTQRSTLGSLTVPSGVSSSDIALKWLPAGKSLSFVYRNKLYITPALMHD